MTSRGLMVLWVLMTSQASSAETVTETYERLRREQSERTRAVERGHRENFKVSIKRALDHEMKRVLVRLAAGITRRGVVTRAGDLISAAQSPRPLLSVSLSNGPFDQVETTSRGWATYSKYVSGAFEARRRICHFEGEVFLSATDVVLDDTAVQPFRMFPAHHRVKIGECLPKTP